MRWTDVDEQRRTGPFRHGGATTMNVAEIEVPEPPPSTCAVANRVW